MSIKMKIEVVTGAASVLMNSEVEDFMQSLGCTTEDYEMLTGSKNWIGKDRNRMFRALEGLLYGVVDSIGVPRFELPAEYVAAVISMFVHPVNYFPACAWLGSAASSNDLCDYTAKQEALEGLEKCTPQQIFALIVRCQNNAAMDALADTFTRKTELRLGRVLAEGEVENGSEEI